MQSSSEQYQQLQLDARVETVLPAGNRSDQSDVAETGNAAAVENDLPGMSKETIGISMQVL